MSERSGKKRLESKTTVKEILEVAIDFERTARDFYTDIIPKVKKNIRYIVEELAEEEQEHYDLFSEMLARKDIEERLKKEIARPVSDHKFSDCIHLPEMGDSPGDQEILEYALMREHIAMEQYHELSTTVEAGPIQDLFLFLANEETKHKNELEKVYYETVHRSGGV